MASGTRSGLEPLRFPRPSTDGPLVAAHRGAITHAPENTIAAFGLAVAQGADMIEFDVHPTRDGRFAVLHDVTLDRTSDGAGLVQDLDAAAIARLTVAGPQGVAERIPMLEDVLAWAKGRAYLNIDVRNYAGVRFYDAATTADKIVRAVTDADATGEVVVQCLDHRLALAVRERCDEVVVGITQHGRPVEPAAICEAAGANFMSIDAAFATTEFVTALHKRGIGLMASVELRLPGRDDSDESRAWVAQRLIELGADVVVTDHVTLTASLVRSEIEKTEKAR